MRLPFIVGYALGATLFAWSLFVGNGEFLIYAVVTTTLLGILHHTDRHFHYHTLVLWLFALWIILHILGGLFVVDGKVLYSTMLIEWIGTPYDILKYDQLVHIYCYFVVALIVATVLNQVLRPDVSYGLYLSFVVLAASGIGAMNEVIEFLAVVSVPETNVGGYENTLIDILANLIGALLAAPLLARNKRLVAGASPARE